MAQIFTTSEHVLRVLQTSIISFTKFVFLGTLTREEGKASLLENWMEWPCLSLKVQLKEYLGEKNPNIFPIRAFVYFIGVAEIFLDVTLFLET